MTQPRTKRVLSVLKATLTGTRLDELKAMQSVIARAIDNVETPARDLSSLARRQMDIGKEIEQIEERIRQESHDGETVPDAAFSPEAL